MSTRSKRARAPSGKAVENVSVVPPKKLKKGAKKGTQSSGPSTPTGGEAAHQQTLDGVEIANQQTLDVAMEERIVLKVTEKTCSCTYGKVANESLRTQPSRCRRKCR